MATKKKVARKLVAVYCPDSIRNEIVARAGRNGFNMSTYMGKPILKPGKIFLQTERIKGL